MIAHAPPPVESERVTVLTCIGCGAMTLPGSCPGGCGAEHRVHLVPAGDHDALAAGADALEGDVRELRDALHGLVDMDHEPADPRAAWREFAGVARGILTRLVPSPRVEPEEALSNAAEAWECPRCGGIDAPRPCLGVCIRRPVAWVAREELERAIARHAALARERDRLLGIVGLAAHLTPRRGCELANWQALQARAGAEL